MWAWELVCCLLDLNQIWSWSSWMFNIKWEHFCCQLRKGWTQMEPIYQNFFIKPSRSPLTVGIMFRLVDLLNIFSLSFDEQKALKELSWKFQPLSDFSFIWNLSGGFNWSDLFEKCYRFTHSVEQKGFDPSSSDLSNFKKATKVRLILIDESYNSHFDSDQDLIHLKW